MLLTPLQQGDTSGGSASNTRFTWLRLQPWMDSVLSPRVAAGSILEIQSWKKRWGEQEEDSAERTQTQLEKSQEIMNIRGKNSRQKKRRAYAFPILPFSIRHQISSGCQGLDGSIFHERMSDLYEYKYLFTLNTWKTASSSIFQSTFPLILLHPKKNSCCFKSCKVKVEACEPQCR